MAPCGFLVNNWVELRSDAFKIATATRRPIPWRADSIGPWLDALGFLSWLGSLTSAAIVTLCRGETKGSSGAASNVKAWGVLLAVLLAEHFYLAVQMGVRAVVSRMDSPGLQQERRERFAVRKRMLGEGAGEKLAQEGLLHGEAGSGGQKTPER
ncbi:anoctamin [Candidatus Bathyarchaeota archaeon]|nr:anoctamin [Candidatus Bathyarchaeota archaeon]